MIDRLDFCAAHAMLAFAVMNDVALHTPDEVARRAYEIARAMVRERECIDRQVEMDRRNGVIP